MTYWGILCSIDLYNCNHKKITNRETIQQYVIDLCELIKMKRFGETQIVHFGEDEKIAGFSMTQLIETSLISGHFANANNAAYIDIFSCKEYDATIAGNFTQQYFQAEKSIINIIYRK